MHNIHLIVQQFKKQFQVKKPICLYCSNKVIKEYSDTYLRKHNCSECKESFAYWDDIDNKGCNFSCNELLVACNISKFDIHNFNFIIGNRYTENSDWLTIPSFIPDFSDKNKLYNKLKMCRIFR